MECPNCGDLLPEGARYCSKCGTRVRERPVSPPAETQAPTSPERKMGASADPLENARVGYQAALSIWIAGRRMIWSRFNMMVVANGLILGAIILTIGNNYALSAPFIRILCLVGLAVSFAWLVSHRRACEHNSYLLFSARELESHLADPVATIARAMTFSQGDEVTLTIDGEKKKLRLSWLARTGLARTESFSYFVIAMLMVLYVAFLFLLFLL
jgi:hypothetical protein